MGAMSDIIRFDRLRGAGDRARAMATLPPLANVNKMVGDEEETYIEWPSKETFLNFFACINCRTSPAIDS